MIGVSLSKPTVGSWMVDFLYIKELVDSLCKIGADAQYMQYLSKSHITPPQILLMWMMEWHGGGSSCLQTINILKYEEWETFWQGWFSLNGLHKTCSKPGEEDISVGLFCVCAMSCLSLLTPICLRMDWQNFLARHRNHWPSQCGWPCLCRHIHGSPVSFKTSQH